MSPFFLRTCFILGCLILHTSMSAQGIRGRLTGPEGEPVAYAAVYDETTSVGVTTNAEGYYDLRLGTGQHSLLFKALGYYLVRRQITVSAQYITLDIEMKEQSYAIAEVVVRPDKEDPAYAIMRRVIGLAPYHLNMVKEYKADVYLRGTIRIRKIPRIIARNLQIEGQRNMIRAGDVFMEESMNEISFHAPDRYDQHVISYHNTYPMDIEGVSPAWIIRSSLYQEEFEGIISPLSTNAFQYYRFRYEGFFFEEGQTIFKIAVIPKRNSQQLLSGSIFITDKLYCLHSVDATIQMFFGTMQYKTLYAPVQSNAWLPIGYQFSLDAKIMGIEGDYEYSSSVKYTGLTLNEGIGSAPLAEADAAYDASGTGNRDVQKEGMPAGEQEAVSEDSNERQQEIDALLGKEELSNRDMTKLAGLMAQESDPDTLQNNSLELKDPENTVTLEENALNRDTAYWNAIRPVPLTPMEARLPTLMQGSGRVTRDTTMMQDSALTASLGKSFGKVGNFMLSGGSVQMFRKSLRVRYMGMIGLNKVDFNTADGFIYRQTFRLEQRLGDAHVLSVDPGIAWTFSRKKLMWWTDVDFDYAFMRQGNLHLYIGSESADYNEASGMNASLNSFVSLFFRRNYLKVYQRDQVRLSNSIDLANGLNLSATLGYRRATPLENLSDYSFFYRDRRDYTDNVPDTLPGQLARNVPNEEAYFDVRLEYTPGYFYRISGGRKHYQYSRFPTFTLRNRTAIPGVAGSSADFSLLEAGIRQRIEWEMMHAFSWSIKAGAFLKRDRIYLMDDKYFSNHFLPFHPGADPDAFRVLPYYSHSTSRYFAEAHLAFTTPYLLVKYLPFLSNKLWCENLHLSYLHTETTTHYWEVGYSISQIYMVGSIGIFAGFEGRTYKGLTIQVAIDL